MEKENVGKEFLALQKKYSIVNPLPPPPPSMPQSPEKPQPSTVKRFKWETKLDSLPTFNPRLAIPHQDITDIKWSPELVKSVHRSSEGSLGVYFIQLSDGTCTVVKAASNHLVSELFCTVLSQALGIRTPKIVVVRTLTEEGTSLLTSLKAADPSWSIVARLFDQAYLYVMEYCKGQSIGAKNGIDELFAPINSPDSPASMKGQEMELSDGCVKFMESIGNLLCLDVFVNNGDRLPLIWDNQGNSGNLFLSTSGGRLREVINLDTQIRAISKENHPKEFADYKNRVQSFLVELKHMVIAGNYRDPLNLAYGKLGYCLKMIQTWTGTQIPADQCIEHICKGFIDTLTHFDGDKIKRLLEEFKSIFRQVKEETPALVDMNSLENGFIDEMTELMKKFSQEIQAEVAKHAI